MSEEPSQNKGRGYVDFNKLTPPPINSTTGHAQAALLFRFCGDFRCGVWLIIVLLDRDINIEICKNRCLMLD